MPSPETTSPIEATKLSLKSSPSAINTIFLPPVDLIGLSDDTEIGTRITAIVNRSLPAFSHSFRTITSTHTVVSLVVDLFSTGAIDIADEFNMNAYIIISSTAMLLSSIYHAPKLDQAYSCEYRDIPGLIQIPGCVPIRGVDLMNPFEDRKTEAYASFLQYWKKLNLGKGIFINSFEEIEHDAIKALNRKQWDNPPVYAVGPLTRTGVWDGGSDDSGCLKWLDNQPPGSVLPAPSDKAASTSYLSAQSVEDPSAVLPEGFLDRTRNSGLSNQPMNAVLLTENMNVALRPKPMENGMMGRDEICKVVKELMEGEEGKKLKSKMGDLKCVATSTLAERGSSFKTFAKVADILELNLYIRNEVQQAFLLQALTID
ncbi:hydroquinone glucosyltransferase-like [Papaver somniferum]|uniref:hydroquinone glucosyltransferase-like n=1 Tax=Papaver somniferum TaxID=3469 RepID=UPI000E700B99|nr:hydroquinone glucosyltransferase-like [Papaver somniferum]